MEKNREKGRKKLVDNTLDMFSESEVLVVVEGAHDVQALRRFGIEAITYAQLLAGRIGRSIRVFYLVLDRDRGGAEKEGRIVSYIHESYPGSVVNTTAGARLLKMLGVTSTEQVTGPINEIRRRAEGEGTGFERRNR